MWNKGELLFSKTLVFLMAVATVCIWLFFASKRIDLLLVCWSAITIFVLIFDKLKDLFEPLKIKLVPFCLTNGFFTTFLFTSMISGDFDPKDEVSRVCWGLTHMHHWWVFLIPLALFLRIPVRPKETRERANWSLISHWIARTIFALVALSIIFYPIAPHWWGNRSFCIEFTIIAIVIESFARMVKSDREIVSHWFCLALASISGIILAIVCNGSMGILKDYVLRHEYPSSFIFFNDTKACPIPTP